MSSLSISANDKDGKTSTFSGKITSEEITRAKTFLDGLQTDEGNDPTKRVNSAGGLVTGATSSSEAKTEPGSSAKEAAAEDPKAKGRP